MGQILGQTRLNVFRSSRTLLVIAIAFLIVGSVSAEEPNTDVTEPTLKVAVVSPRCVFADVKANLSHFTKFIEQAAELDARLICFPELALVSYSTHKDVLKVAEEIPGPTTRELEAIARRLDVYISVGMAERDGNRHHIAQILVGPKGYLGKYRKNHPTGGEQSSGFAPGKSFPTWDIDGFRFGILICFDGRHQDTLDAMKKAHVDVIHHPHGNGVGGLGREAEEWTRSKAVYFVPRAVTARAYMLVNNSAEDTIQPHGNMKYSSGALVIDPLGQIVNRTKQEDRKEKMIFATLRKPKVLIPTGELNRLKEDSTFKERFSGMSQVDFQAFGHNEPDTTTHAKRPGTYVTIDLNLPEGAKPLTLRRIEAGEFMMGCDLDAFYRIGREWPSHKVVITRPFYMGIYEVTQAQWESVMGENPATGTGVGDNFPVHGINMDKTREFLKRLGQSGRKFRLPTEAEWEYACKAGSNTRFCFGDAEKYDSGAKSCPELDKYAWWRWNQEERPDGPQEVGQKLPNDWGLHDMHGNLWELCEDYLIRGKPKLEGTIRYDPLETTVTKECLTKGGSHDTAIFHMHLADRTGGEIAKKNYGILCGLRVVMKVPKLLH